MRLREIATQVKVIDRDKPFYYWVTVANRDKALSNAITKHRKAMGTAAEHVKDLAASIVDKTVEEAFSPPSTNPSVEEVERCSEFSSAEAYANSAYNQYQNPRNPAMLRAFNQEVERLKSSWNYYHKLGLIKPKPKGMSRFI